MDTQRPPGLLSAVEGRADPGGEQSTQRSLCVLQYAPALTCSGSEGLRSYVGGADGREVGGKLPLGISDVPARLIHTAPGARGLDTQPGEFPACDGDDVRFDQRGRDASGGRASSGAGSAGTGVDNGSGLGPAHRVAARLAADEPGEQRRLAALSAPGPRAGHLRGLELVGGDDRRMRLVVDVAADAELAEVDPVGEQAAGAAVRQAEPLRDPHEGLTRGARPEGPLHIRGAVVGHESPRLRVAPVAGRRLSPLPDPGVGGEAGSFLEALALNFPLMLRDAEQQEPLKTPAWRGRVDAFTYDNDPTARGLHPIPRAQLLPDVPAEPGQVADDDACELSALDPFDGREQGGALLKRQPTAHVEFRREERELGSGDRSDTPLDVGQLLFVGVKAVPVSPPDEADSNDPGVDLTHDTGA